MLPEASRLLCAAPLRLHPWQGPPSRQQLGTAGSGQLQPSEGLHRALNSGLHEWGGVGKKSRMSCSLLQVLDPEPQSWHPPSTSSGLPEASCSQAILLSKVAGRSLDAGGRLAPEQAVLMANSSSGGACPGSAWRTASAAATASACLLMVLARCALMRPNKATMLSVRWALRDRALPSSSGSLLCFASLARPAQPSQLCGHFAQKSHSTATTWVNMRRSLPAAARSTDRQALCFVQG